MAWNEEEQRQIEQYAEIAVRTHQPQVEVVGGVQLCIVDEVYMRDTLPPGEPMPQPVLIREDVEGGEINVYVYKMPGTFGSGTKLSKIMEN